MAEPKRDISAFRRPTPLATSAERREFEQTSSPKSGLEWAGVYWAGFISWRMTGTPKDAALRAASQPARPPPITVIESDIAGCYHTREDRTTARCST